MQLLGTICDQIFLLQFPDKVLYKKYLENTCDVSHIHHFFCSRRFDIQLKSADDNPEDVDGKWEQAEYVQSDRDPCHAINGNPASSYVSSDISFQ